MTLDPQVVAWRAARAAAGTAPLYTQNLAEARAADLAAIRAGAGQAAAFLRARFGLTPAGPSAGSRASGADRG